jgi:DNA-binding CsgD family transcriptional regulator/tetratricopeptide (TPR) repeat protein
MEKRCFPWKNKTFNLISINFFNVCFFMGFFSLKCIGQDEIPDLLNQLKESRSDTNKVWVYRDLAYYYLKENLDSAIFFGRKGAELSKDLGFIKGEIWSLYQVALAEEFADRFEASVATLNRAYYLAETHSDSLSMAKLLNALGVTYYYQSRTEDAIAYYQNALQLAEKIDYKEGKSYSLNNLGVIHRQRRNFRKALEVYEKSLRIKIAESDTTGIVNSHYNLGLLYSYIGDYERSLNEFSNAANLNKNRIETDHNLAQTNIGLGVALYNLEHFEKAQEHLKEGLASLNPSFAYEKISALAYLGIIEIRSTNGKSGLTLLQQAHEMVENTERLELKRLVKKEMALAYEILQQPDKSLEFWKAYNTLNDSIDSEQRHWAIEEMQARFEAIEKDKIINLQELQLAKEKSQKSHFILLTIFLAIASMGTIYYFFKRRKKENPSPVVVHQEIIRPSLELDFKKINTKLLSPLTNRESEIVRLVEEGLTNSEIAERLFVSENTVKTHLKNVFSKTNALNRTDLIYKLRSY